LIDDSEPEIKLIAIFDSVGARINQTNKCILEPISSEPIISIINARRAMILTVLGSHERVDMRPTKKMGEKWCLYCASENTYIASYLYNLKSGRSAILGGSSLHI